MTGPTVSIIIPCYNAETYIGEAIESALTQTYPNREVVVVDDGSTDGSLDVIRSFGDRVRWHAGPNRKQPAARNQGIRMAVGELTQFLDADDLLYPNKLERQVALMQEDDSCMWVADGVITVDGQPVDRYAASWESDDPVVFALKNRIQPEASLYRTALLREYGGFREDMKLGEERDLHLRMALGGLRFRRLPEFLYTYRRVPNSASSDRLLAFRCRHRVLMDALERCQRASAMTPVRAEAFSDAIAFTGRSFLSAGRRDEAMKCFREAKRIHPWGGARELYHTRLGRVLHRFAGPMLADRIARAGVRYREHLFGKPSVLKSQVIRRATG